MSVSLHTRPDIRSMTSPLVSTAWLGANLDRPDLRILYYKPISGSTGGNYLAVFALTQASRDKYWPGGADSDQLRDAFSSDLAELRTELITYLVEGSYAADSNLAAAVFESREWTDFVLVSAGAPPPRPKR